MSNNFTEKAVISSSKYVLKKENKLVLEALIKVPELEEPEGIITLILWVDMEKAREYVRLEDITTELYAFQGKSYPSMVDFKDELNITGNEVLADILKPHIDSLKSEFAEIKNNYKKLAMISEIYQSTEPEKTVFSKEYSIEEHFFNLLIGYEMFDAIELTVISENDKGTEDVTILGVYHDDNPTEIQFYPYTDNSLNNAQPLRLTPSDVVIDKAKELLKEYLEKKACLTMNNRNGI